MEDLSSLAPSLTAESMAAVNTVSSNTAMTAPGSASESTTGYIVGDPGPVLPAPRERTVLHPSGAPRVPNPWRRADGSPWQESADEASPGRAAGGHWGQS